jgi:hypothetical protein
VHARIISSSVSLAWMSNKSEATAKRPGICPGLYLYPNVGLTALG